ncbi:MAG: zinc-ribbon domain-containing protein [Planctomycetota bacterium]
MTSDYGRDNDGRNEFRRDERADNFRRDEPSGDPRHEGFRTSEPKSGGVGCKIIAGCLFFVFLFFLCFGGVAVFLYQTYKEVDPYCREYLTLTDQQKYKELYDMLHPTWQSQMPYEIFVALEDARRIKHGSLIDITYESGHSSTDNGVSTATFVYRVTYEKGTARITFLLEKLDGVWKIIDAQFDSDALNSVATCPSCNAPLDPNAKFCSSCGREITPFDWINNMEEQDSDDESIEEDAVEPLEPEPEAVR